MLGTNYYRPVSPNTQHRPWVRHQRDQIYWQTYFSVCSKQLRLLMHHQVRSLSPHKDTEACQNFSWFEFFSPVWLGNFGSRFLTHDWHLAQWSLPLNAQLHSW